MKKYSKRADELETDAYERNSDTDTSGHWVITDSFFSSYMIKSNAPQFHLE